jgi:hypothetical protein
VGWYLAFLGALTFAALLLSKETRAVDLEAHSID